MTSDPLAVQIVVSDPWEFTTEAGDNVFTGSVRLASSDEGAPRFPLVLRLQESVRATPFEGTDIFVATSYEGEGYNRLLEGGSVECSLTGISKDQAEGAEPFDISGLRGKFPAARATLRLA
jgi:hypothetical protein